MSSCTGYKRKAKFAPGSELIDETKHLLVADVVKCDYSGYAYKVYDFDKKDTKVLSPLSIEKMSFLGLINIGNFRLLHGDVDGEEKTYQKPKIEIRQNPDGTIQFTCTWPVPI